MATLNIKNLPDDLAQKLRERAKRERRSVTQEVIHLLANALSEDESSSILELRGLGRELWRNVDAAEHVSDERESWD